ncbi:MAG: 2-amino-3,7-dideoxy-D-threo-hept-6-ulosonate synthase [Chloroflexi bacterium]|nr:2-amino-3,7-dideoxy-D-threo-hept-6-ulosonate synthase [Chloroflexota bacterium]
MSNIGKAIRLSQILNPTSHNAIVMALDHGAVLGPISGIVDPVKTISTLNQERPDTWFIPMGVVKLAYESFVSEHIPFLLSIDTCTYMGPEPDLFLLTDTVESALRVGASGVAMHALIGPERTSEMLHGLAKISQECDKMGMPLLAIMYPEGFENTHAVEHVKWVARIGAELGADVVKTYYTGSKETFAEVVAACPVPVMVSGGSKSSDPIDYLVLLKNVMEAGGRGGAVGRNIWQYRDPRAMLRATKKIVHAGASVDEAAAELGLTVEPDKAPNSDRKQLAYN